MSGPDIGNGGDILSGHCESFLAAAIFFRLIMNPVYSRGRKKPGYAKLNSVKMTNKGIDAVIQYTHSC